MQVQNDRHCKSIITEADHFRPMKRLVRKARRFELIVLIPSNPHITVFQNHAPPFRIQIAIIFDTGIQSSALLLQCS